MTFNETFTEKVREKFTVEEVLEMLSFMYEDYGTRVLNAFTESNGDDAKTIKKTAKYMDRIIQSEIILSKLLSVSPSELMDIHRHQYNEWKKNVKFEPVYSKGKRIGKRPTESFVIK